MAADPREFADALNAHVEPLDVCSACGIAMKRTVADFEFPPWIIVDGEVRVCESCGYEEYVVPRMLDLIVAAQRARATRMRFRHGRWRVAIDPEAEL